MTRIEKTQINLSAFIVISSTLKEIQSDQIIEITDGGKKVIIRPKKAHEKHQLSIDLTFLEQISKTFLFGAHAPIVLTGEAEQYLRSCSYACYYYKTESKELTPLDFFGLFHQVHFTDIPADNFADVFVQRLLGLFRIDPLLAKTFLKPITVEIGHKLNEPKAVNEVFSRLVFTTENGRNKMILESGKIDMMKSIDSLFSAKDLLFASGFNVQIIPESHVFAIQKDEQVSYKFENTAINMTLIFKYDQFKIEVLLN